MRRSPFCLALPLALALAAPARATTVVDVPVEQMAKTSPLVVRGVVESQKSFWSEDGRKLIFTRTVLRVVRALKGDAGTHVAVRQTGGALGGIAMEVAGTARFEAGEEVVIFLEPHPGAPGEFVPVAMAAAKFTVKPALPGLDGPVAVRDVSDLVFARAGADGQIKAVEDRPAAVLPLDQLLRVVEAARTAR